MRTICRTPQLTVIADSSASVHLFSYGDGTRFWIRNYGRQVQFSWCAPYTLEDALVYLFGPILGFALHTRKIVPLHAGAVNMGGKAVAIMGHAGAGKSSTVAAFAMRGVPVLTDDIATLDERTGDGFLVQPALPQVKLWPSSAEMLFGAADALPPLTPNWEKCYLDLNQPEYTFESEPLPLAAIYLLGERKDDESAHTVEPVTGREAILALIANTYCNYAMLPEHRMHQFDVFRRLLPQIPIRKVIPHSDPKQIWSLCDTIADDFEKNVAPSVC